MFPRHPTQRGPKVAHKDQTCWERGNKRTEEWRRGKENSSEAWAEIDDDLEAGNTCINYGNSGKHKFPRNMMGGYEDHGI